MSVISLSAPELQAKIQQEPNLLLLDVREPQEFAFAKIDGSLLIPLAQIPANLDQLKSAAGIAVICHHGIRSQQAAQYLSAQGLAPIFNLRGGIDAWSLSCDPSVPRY